jgi:hypothetical protein
LLADTQSVSALHVARHVVMFAHSRPPGQDAELPELQLPVPLQVPPIVRLPLLHCGPLPHDVPEATCWHIPPAAQSPVLPQLPLGEHWPEGAGKPAVMAAQVPVVPPVSAFVHAMQVPVQAVLQQTPSTQLPLVQSSPSSAALHVAPGPPFAVHIPPLQYAPVTHWLSMVQELSQAVPPMLQTYSPQGLVPPPTLQLPEALQVFALVSVLPVQDCAAQIAPVTAFPQVPVPVPDSLSDAAQAWQLPLHAVLQQKPSTQKPLRHWSIAVQVAPGAPLSAQLLPTQ